MGLQFPLEHCLTRGHQEIQQPPSLLVTRCYHRQDRLRNPSYRFTPAPRRMV